MPRFQPTWIQVKKKNQLINELKKNLCCQKNWRKMQEKENTKEK